jgi:flagellar motility protein MotE (MotC chaperone)
LDAVKPIEEKHGVYSYPVSREILESHLLESESEFQGKVSKKTTFMTRIKTVYRFVNIDNPTDFIDTVTFAEGIDSQDKGSGKAMTYADKYALMKGYKISTGDDPDGEASIDSYYNNAKDQNEKKVVKVEKPTQNNAVKVAKTNDSHKVVQPITRAEMVEKWGVKSAEETLAWFETKFDAKYQDWTDEHHDAARAILENRKKKREAEAAKMREGLKNASGDLPFDIGR